MISHHAWPSACSLGVVSVSFPGHLAPCLIHVAAKLFLIALGLFPLAPMHAANGVPRPFDTLARDLDGGSATHCSSDPLAQGYDRAKTSRFCPLRKAAVRRRSEKSAEPTLRSKELGADTVALLA